MKKGFLNLFIKFGKWFNFEVKKCLSCNSKFLKQNKNCNCEICKKIDNYFRGDNEKVQD